MEKQVFWQSRYFKFLFPLVAVYILLEIFQQGHAFGQWLYALLH